MMNNFKLGEAEQAIARNLVWQVLKSTVTQHMLVLPKDPRNIMLSQHAACFVTLYVRGELKGCIGTKAADKPLWENICRYTYNSACRDPRFEPLTESELAQLSFHISILTPFKRIENRGEQALIEQLKRGKDGLVIEHGHRNALFLPSVWESLPEPKNFIGKLKVKAGFDEDYWHEDMKLFVFQSVSISS